jgi:hypothetical protein
MSWRRRSVSRSCCFRCRDVDAGAAGAQRPAAGVEGDPADRRDPARLPVGQHQPQLGVIVAAIPGRLRQPVVEGGAIVDVDPLQQRRQGQRFARREAEQLAPLLAHLDGAVGDVAGPGAQVRCLRSQRRLQLPFASSSASCRARSRSMLSA